MTLPQGDYCDDGELMALTFILECDDSQDDLLITNQADFDDGSCSNTIKMKSKYGNFIFFISSM